METILRKAPIWYQWRMFSGVHLTGIELRFDSPTDGAPKYSLAIVSISIADSYSQTLDDTLWLQRHDIILQSRAIFCISTTVLFGSSHASQYNHRHVKADDILYDILHSRCPDVRDPEYTRDPTQNADLERNDLEDRADPGSKLRIRPISANHRSTLSYVVNSIRTSKTQELGFVKKQTRYQGIHCS